MIQSDLSVILPEIILAVYAMLALGFYFLPAMI